MELLRRYSNRPDLTGPLVRALQDIDDHAAGCHEDITTVTERTASPGYVRRVRSDGEITELLDAYRAGTTAKVLAEQYGVHTSTIKKKLRKYGIQRSKS